MQFKPLAAVMVAALTAVPGAAASGVSAVRPDTSPARSVATAPRTLPPGLPTHFGFGLSAHPDESGIDGWMPDSGVAWDYAYQYLSGGVNTGSGWQTWNTSAQFPLFYAQGASSHGYIPVFPYYQLLQSTGPCGSCGESQRDLSHLNDPGTMNSYYRDFVMLMKRLGPKTYGGIHSFGATAVVQVEPDLSGYAEQAVLLNTLCYGLCTGQGNDPSLLRASVASSGLKAVRGFPDTYRGFNLALLHLRDRYAPNVLLAFHVSDWATLYDIGSSTDSNLDATTLGQEAGTFAARSGRFDLIFNDVADRDAAFSKYVYGRDVFWDRLNMTYPNFHRWEAYLTAVTGATGLPAVVWQVPEGNQWFRSVDDAWGHYQDNRAEYFFAHVDELVSAGAIAVLFGAGNAGSTVHTDGQGDGVTNPAPLCTSDGLSSGQICNDHTSAYADDDGGFIRLSAAAYYVSPVPIP